MTSNPGDDLLYALKRFVQTAAPSERTSEDNLNSTELSAARAKYFPQLNGSSMQESRQRSIGSYHKLSRALLRTSASERLSGPNAILTPLFRGNPAAHCSTSVPILYQRIGYQAFPA